MVIVGLVEQTCVKVKAKAKNQKSPKIPSGNVVLSTILEVDFYGSDKSKQDFLGRGGRFPGRCFIASDF